MQCKFYHTFPESFFVKHQLCGLVSYWFLGISVRNTNLVEARMVCWCQSKSQLSL